LPGARSYNDLMNHISGSHLDCPLSESEDNIAEQAITWFVRMRAENVAEDARAEFRNWLDSSPAHSRAFESVAAFWEHPDFTQVLHEMPVSVLKHRPQASQRNYVRSAVLAFAACAALIAIIYRPSAFTCLQADFCTAVGEVKSVQLSDGSRITLNSNSAISVNINTDMRQVTLAHGEAFFDVRRDLRRPFQVDGNYSVVRVLGTRFNVREDERSDTVTVVSGIVEVGQDGKRPLLLRANDRIIVGNQQTSTIQQVSSIATSAWVKGSLLFDNVPLQAVVSEISRYRRGTIIFNNDRLKNLQVSGRFDMNDTDKALQSLEQTLPIRLYRITPWLVIVS